MFDIIRIELSKNGADRQIRTADLTLTKGALYQLSHISIHLQRLERVAGIEPASSAWKAEVIASIRHPLILSDYLCQNLCLRKTQIKIWWREVDSNHRRLSRQIYSLIPLATREPLQYIPTPFK